MDHADARKQSLEEWKLFQNSVVDPIMEGLGEEFELVAEEVEAIIGKLNINSASFRFSGERAEGRGLYPTLSLVSHSCVANARYQGEDIISLWLIKILTSPLNFFTSESWWRLLCCPPGQERDPGGWGGQHPVRAGQPGPAPAGGQPQLRVVLRVRMREVCRPQRVRDLRVRPQVPGVPRGPHPPRAGGAGRRLALQVRVLWTFNFCKCSCLQYAVCMYCLILKSLTWISL